jgi:hypothetical protein
MADFETLAAGHLNFRSWPIVIPDTRGLPKFEPWFAFQKNAGSHSRPGVVRRECEMLTFNVALTCAR